MSYISRNESVFKCIKFTHINEIDNSQEKDENILKSIEKSYLENFVLV